MGIAFNCFTSLTLSGMTFFIRSTEFCFLNPFMIVSFLILKTNLETNYEFKRSKKELILLNTNKQRKKRFRLIIKVKSLLFLEAPRRTGRKSQSIASIHSALPTPCFAAKSVVKTILNRFDLAFKLELTCKHDSTNHLMRLENEKSTPIGVLFHFGKGERYRCVSLLMKHRLRRYDAFASQI